MPDPTYGPKVYNKQGGDEIVVASGGKITIEAGGDVVSAQGAIVYHTRVRATIAQLNAGLSLLPALTGFKYRLIDATMIAIGGAAAAATSVDVLATQAAGSVKLVSAAVAALTRSAVVKPNSANVTVLADGASFIQNDSATAITAGVTGSALTTATAIDILLAYAVEAG